MKPLNFRQLALFLGLSFLFANPSYAESQTLLVFGDSLSAAYGIREDQGWVNLFTQKVKNRQYDIEIVNASVSGETTTGGLARLPASLAAHSPQWVILELGGNDGLRGLPLSMLEDNLATMIALIEDAGATVILAGIQIPPNYGPRYTVPFFEIYGNLAASEQVHLIPFLIEGIPEQPQLMQADGIHPTAQAQSLIVDNVWPVIEPLLGNPVRRE